MGRSRVQRLARRGDIFWFRMAVPAALVSRFGLTEIKGTLRTQDRMLATRRCRRLSNSLDALMDIVASSDLSQDTVRALLRGCFERCLENADAEIDAAMGQGRTAPDLLAECEKECAEVKSQLAGRNPQLWTAVELVGMAADAGIDLSRLSPRDRQRLVEGIYRAHIEGYRYRAARLSGDFTNQLPADPLFEGVEVWNSDRQFRGHSLTPVQTAFSIGDGVDQYVAFKEGKEWVRKTLLENKRVLSLFLQVFGKARELRTLNASDVRRFRDVLKTIPASYMKAKANSGKSIEEVLKNPAGAKTLADKTAGKYFHNLKAFLKWCCDEEYLDAVPGAGIKFAGSKSDARDARHPFSNEQLTRLFSSPQYKGHQSVGRRNEPGNMVVRDGNFWIPLIGLYSGMRLGEIVQLLLTDIRSSDDIWYFSVARAEGEVKQIKSDAGHRWVPIHPQLINLGLLECRAAELAKGGKGRLFPEILPGKDGYFSHNFSKSFSRYLKIVGVKTPKTSFHSFRHNFKDALVAAGIEESRRRALMGHADSSVHGAYGSQVPIAALAADIRKISYPIEPLIKLQSNYPVSTINPGISA